MPSQEIIQANGSSKATYALRYAWRWMTWRLAVHMPVRRWRVALYRAMGVRVGRDVYIGYDVAFDRSFPHLITLEDHAAVGDRCIVNAHSAMPTQSELRRQLPLRTAAVTIGSGAWVQPGCTISPGVSVGRGAIVATGAVVTRDVPAHTLVGGVPATTIKPLCPAPGPSAPNQSSPKMCPAAGPLGPAPSPKNCPAPGPSGPAPTATP